MYYLNAFAATKPTIRLYTQAVTNKYRSSFLKETSNIDNNNMMI